MWTFIKTEKRWWTDGRRREEWDRLAKTSISGNLEDDVKTRFVETPCFEEH
jgi:hypothetical protein